MNTKLANLWDASRSSYWLVPAGMTALATALSFLTVAIDHSVGIDPREGQVLIYAGGAEGARALLSAVATSIITVAGVGFSVTVVSLSLASSQFGSRLLRTFLRDPGNQVVLGMFIATFTYCLLVLRTIRGPGDGTFVPHVSVTVGTLLALASVGMLIYFIHHTSTRLQAETVIASAAGELRAAIDRLFPTERGGERPGRTESQANDLPDGAAGPVPADRSGYVQGIDEALLVGLAEEHDVVLRLERRPGHFAVEGAPLCHVWPAARVDEQTTREINGACIIGPQRTPTQDVEFAVDQLVQIGVRALSPGINDPFTAMACVDQLGAALSRFAQRPPRSTRMYGGAGRLRLVADRVTFRGMADAAFNQLRQYGVSSAAVSARLLETIAVLARQARDEEQRAALLEHARMVEAGSRAGLTEKRDREDMRERYEAVLRAVAESAAAGRSREVEKAPA